MKKGLKIGLIAGAAILGFIFFSFVGLIILTIIAVVAVSFLGGGLMSDTSDSSSTSTYAENAPGNNEFEANSFSDGPSDSGGDSGGGDGGGGGGD
jgi:uncharacterized SAM-binding protein YcdF (DUF218 family)